MVVLFVKIFVAALFVVSGGAVFTTWGRRHLTLSLMAAFVALVGSYYLGKSILNDLKNELINDIGEAHLPSSDPQSSVQSQKVERGSISSSISNDTKEKIGLVKGDCLSIEDSSFAPGTEVHIVTLEQPQQIYVSDITQRRTSGCVPRTAERLISYTLSLQGVPNYVDIAVGIVNLSHPPKFVDGKWSVVLSDAPGPVTFKECTSNEGVHTTAWRDGKRIWHIYEWLPYSTVPNCTPEEIAVEPN